jgi:hypothetical protein
MTVAAYRNGDYGLNECSRVYGVPKATIRRHAMKKNWQVNGVKALGRQATFSGDSNYSYSINMLEECFLG